MAPLNIIIVGAGIAGPAAAIGLARNGHNVTIYERSTSTSEVGYAFRLTPNSDRCLKYLGIDSIAGGAVSANVVRSLDAEGKILMEVRENEDADKAKTGTSVFAYRPQVHQQLMKAALESGVKLRTGAIVTSVDVTNTAIAVEGEGYIFADLILAADGVHSAVRSHVLNSDRFVPRASTGHNAFRFMLSKSLVQNDHIMSSLVDDNAHMFTWNVHGKRILVYPVDYNKQFNVTCTHPEELSDKETASGDSAAAIAYNQKASLDTVLSIYEDFGPQARRLLEIADPNGFRVWKLQDMDEIPQWSSNHTVLLGDACHPVAPFGFSGASMGIEDALTLSTLLTADTTIEQITDRLRLYEKIRKPRVARVRDTAREIAKGLDDKDFIGRYREFLSSYDAVAHAKEALASEAEVNS